MSRKDQIFIIGVVLMVGGFILLLLSFMIDYHFTAILESIPFVRETDSLKNAGMLIYFIMPISLVMCILGGITMFLNLKGKEKIN